MRRIKISTTFALHYLLIKCLPLKREKKKAIWKELKSLLDLYREVSTRGVQIKAYYDSRIDEIVERLKEIGS